MANQSEEMSAAAELIILVEDVLFNRRRSIPLPEKFRVKDVADVLEFEGELDYEAYSSSQKLISHIHRIIVDLVNEGELLHLGGSGRYYCVAEE